MEIKKFRHNTIRRLKEIKEEQVAKLQSAAERKDAMIEKLVSELLKLKSE